MATRVGVGYISMIPLNCATLNTPVSCKNFADISYVNRDLANFVLKLANLHYHGNKGRSGTNFNDAVKLAHPENTLFGANISSLSLTVPEL